MKFKLRPYQEEASKKAVEFFLDEKKNWNALEVLGRDEVDPSRTPTGEQANTDGDTDNT